MFIINITYMISVTAVLNIYKRIDNLELQLQSLISQSHPISEYIIWSNNILGRDSYLPIIKKYVPNAVIIESQSNMGVWSRFFASYNAKTDYVFIIDDDVIPGNKWVEICITNDQVQTGIYGSRGSIFKSLETRKERILVTESKNKSNELQQVDISGHSRLFRKEYLSYMFDCLPTVNYPTAGEELWISYRAMQHGIPTYIPPMSDDIETRGNKRDDLQNDEVANYITERDKYQQFYEYAIQHGFRPFSL